MHLVRQPPDEHLRVRLRVAEVEVGAEGAATVGDSVDEERRLHAVAPDHDAVPVAVVHRPTDVDLHATVSAVDDVEDEANAASRVHHLRKQWSNIMDGSD